jgi:hypothetical protein
LRSTLAVAASTLCWIKRKKKGEEKGEEEEAAAAAATRLLVELQYHSSIALPLAMRRTRKQQKA